MSNGSREPDMQRIVFHLGGLLAALLEESGVDLGGNANRLMGVSKCCEYLDVGETKFRELVAAGEIPESIDVGGRPKWRLRDLDKYTNRQQRLTNS